MTFSTAMRDGCADSSQSMMILYTLQTILTPVTLLATIK